MSTNLEFHEIEVKYRIDESRLNDWKRICREQATVSASGFKYFLYVDSDDIYYTNPAPTKGLAYQFIRHRINYSDPKKGAELTTKKKLKGSNNIFRLEWNIPLATVLVKTIKSWITGGLGYDYSFTIEKYVQLYKFKDATLPFYTVVDADGKRDTFLEIEVDEEALAKGDINEAGAWKVIEKYEKILAPLGVKPQKRLKLSLFEMYRPKGEKNV